MNLDLTAMWRQLQKALGIPLIEQPETKIILPVDQTASITGVDLGTGKDETIVMVKSEAGPPVYGPSLFETGGILNSKQSNKFIDLLKQADKLRPQVKWTTLADPLVPPAHASIEEALRHRNVPGKGVLKPNLEDQIMKAMTGQIAKDIDQVMFGQMASPEKNIYIDPKFVYMGGANILGDYNKKRRFRHDSVEDALRMRHHKPVVQFEEVNQQLYSMGQLKPMAIKRTSFFPLHSLDGLWGKK